MLNRRKTASILLEQLVIRCPQIERPEAAYVSGGLQCESNNRSMNHSTNKQMLPLKEEERSSQRKSLSSRKMMHYAYSKCLSHINLSDHIRPNWTLLSGLIGSHISSSDYKLNKLRVYYQL